MSNYEFTKQNWKNLFSIFRTYPRTFFKQLSLKNVKAFCKAIANEPPQQILLNIKKLFSETTENPNQTLKYSLSKFKRELEPLNGNKTVICISHEATRTGAPAIILNIGKYFKSEYDLNVIYLLCVGGERKSEFEAISPSYELGFFHNEKFLDKEMSQLIDILQSTDIQAIYFNSESSTRLLQHFKKNNLGLRISLIHEMGSYYEKNSWEHISNDSDKIIFPCQKVKELALENSAFDSSKLLVQGQGLMKTELLTIDRENAHRQLREELELDKDAFVVLTCGSRDARKGIDIFTFTAIQALRDTNEDIHFVWLGDAALNDYKIWTERDVEQLGLKNRIHFIGSRSDVSIYFCGSDLFFMSSRGDPFPCVVHEALAAGLPIIAFEGTGGTPEMVPDGCGEILNYLNIPDAAKSVLKYAKLKNEAFQTISLACREHASNTLDFRKYTAQLRNQF